MTAEGLRILLANCAGAFLLALATVALVAVSGLMWVTLRGLRHVRREMPGWMAQLVPYIRGASSATRETTSAAVRPQIRLLSTMAGLRAGARALLGRPPDDDTPPRPPV